MIFPDFSRFILYEVISPQHEQKYIAKTLLKRHGITEYPELEVTSSYHQNNTRTIEVQLLSLHRNIPESHHVLESTV